MYVEAVKDGKRTYTHIFLHNFLNIQPIFNLQILCILKHVEDVKDYIMQHKMESTHCIGAHVEDVEGVKYYE